MRWHVDLRVCLHGNDQVQGAGHAAAGYDDRSELRAFHYSVIVVDCEAARGHAFALGRVTFETGDIEYRLDIVREADLPLATAG